MKTTALLGLLPLLVGCGRENHTPQSAAIAAEQAAAEELEKIAEYVSRDDSGRIQAIDLAGASITETTIRTLNKLYRLEELNLFGSTINDDLFAEVKGHDSLKALGLANTEISDHTLESLNRFSSLSTLDLNNTSVSEAGLLQLERLPNLGYSGIRVARLGVACYLRWVF